MYSTVQKCNVRSSVTLDYIGAKSTPNRVLETNFASCIPDVLECRIITMFPSDICHFELCTLVESCCRFSGSLRRFGIRSKHGYM